MATTTMERRRSDGDGLASAVPPIRGNNQLMSTVWGGVVEREGRFWGDGTAEKCRGGVDWVVAFELHSINSKPTFRSPQCRKRTGNYSAYVLGVTLRYRRHCEIINDDDMIGR